MKISFNKRETQSSNVVAGMQIPYAPGKRAFARWRWYLIVLLTASPLLYLILKLLFGFLVVTAPGKVHFTTYMINAPVEAIVKNIPVQPGQLLEKNALVIELFDPRLEDQVALLLAEQTSRQDRGADNDISPTLYDAVTLARKNVARAFDHLYRVRRLVKEGAATRAELNLAESRLDTMQGELARAESALSVATTFTPTSVSDAQLRLMQIRTELSQLQNSAQRLSISTRGKRMVVDVSVVEGQSVVYGEPLVHLADTDATTLHAYLSPADVDHVQIGAKPFIRFPNGFSMKAEVTSIARVTRRMPPELASVFSIPEQSIEVRMVPETPLPVEITIEGIPFTTYFGFSFLSFGIDLPTFSRAKT